MEKMLFVYSDKLCSCTRKNTFELEKGLSYFLETNTIFCDQLTEEHFKANDIIFIQRMGANEAVISEEYKEYLFNLIEKYKDKKYNKLILYNIDDLILERQKNLPLELIERVDAVFVPNEVFSKYLYAYNRNIYFTRTFIDIETIENIPNDLKLSDSKIKFLYPSTASAGDKFMRILIPELIKNYPKCEIYTLGSKKYDKEFSNTKSFPTINFERFIKFFKACDIILNPVDLYEIDPRLIKEIFHTENPNVLIKDFLNSKSEIKYLDAAITKKPIISSPTESYKYAIKHKINGFIPNNKVEEWLECVDIILKNKKMKNKVIETAYEDVYENYNLDITSERIISSFIEIYNNKFKKRL